MGNSWQHRQRRSIGSRGRCAEVNPGVVFMLTSQLLLRLMARLLLLADAAVDDASMLRRLLQSRTDA